METKKFVVELEVAGGKELLALIMEQQPGANSYQLGAVVSGALLDNCLAAVLVNCAKVWTAKGKKGTPYADKNILSIDAYYELRTHLREQADTRTDEEREQDAEAQEVGMQEYLTEKFAAAAQLAQEAQEAPVVIKTIQDTAPACSAQPEPVTLVEAVPQVATLPKLASIQELLTAKLAERNQRVISQFETAWGLITSARAQVTAEFASIKPLEDEARQLRLEADRLEGTLLTNVYQGQGKASDWTSTLATLERLIADRWIGSKIELNAAATVARQALEEHAQYEAATKAQVKALIAKASGLTMQAKELRAKAEAHAAKMQTTFKQESPINFVWALSQETMVRTSDGRNPKGLAVSH